MTLEILDGRYQVQNPIGSGGQGKVFRGRDLLTGAGVAIKVLDKDPSPEAVARFAQEGRLAARIRDPHLVAALHFGVSEGRRFIVYEYLEGAAPVTTLAEKGRLDPCLVCDIASQLLGALDALHQAGVAHLDLAPANCLWRQRSSGRIEVFLADLGSAAAAIPVTGGPRRSSEPVGSAYFMAPEMIEGAPVDHRADLWSLGALMYLLLVGHYVDMGDDEEPLEVPPPVMLVPKIPQAISDVVMTALARVERRFSSAVEMMAAIDAAMSRRPALNVPTPRRTGMPVWAGVTGMVLAAGMGSLLGLQFDAVEAPPATACTDGALDGRPDSVPEVISRAPDRESADPPSENAAPPEISPQATYPPPASPESAPPLAEASSGQPAKPLTWSTVVQAVQRQAGKLRRCSTDDAVTLGLQVSEGRVKLESFDGKLATSLPHHECVRKVLAAVRLPATRKLSGVVAVVLEP